MSTEDQSGGFITWVDDGEAPLAASPPLMVTFDELPQLSLDGPDAQLALGRTIGVGGMADVRVAEQRALRRQVAVKRLKTARDAPEARAGLLREALVQARLDHPHVVPVHLVGADPDGRPLLVMKCVEGAPWSQLISSPQRIPMVTGEAVTDVLEFHVRVLLKVCLALEVAHAHGVLHRDLKPDNVMVGSFGQVWLMDWGLAAAFGPAARDWLTPVEQIATVAGTPGYMAPEMARADGPSMSRATDVYLLGATLHHVLTGEPRHADPDLLARLAHAYASPEATYDGAVPRELAELCNRCCQAEPSARPRGVATVRRVLEGFLEHRASRELAQDAATTTRALLAGTAAFEVADRARFGFDQALRLWPGNRDAHEGKQRLLVALVHRAVDEDRLEEAQRLLSELPEPDLEVARAVDDLMGRRARAARELERLRDREDVSAYGGERAWLWFVVGLFTLLLFVGVDGLRSGGAADFALWLGALGLMSLVVGVAQEVLLPRGRVSEGLERMRRATWVQGASGPLFVVLSWWLEVPFVAGLALHLLAVGLHQLAVRASAGLARHAAYSGYVVILGALALLAAPPWPLATYGCALAAGQVLLGIWSVRAAAESSRRRS